MEEQILIPGKKVKTSELLSVVNQNGRYQRFVFFYFLILSVALSLIYVNIAYVFYSPDFFCLNEDGSSFECSETIACHNRFGFYIESNRKSLTITHKLYCEDKYIETLSKNLIFGLTPISGLIVSIISDLKGRLILNVFGGILLLIGTLLCFSEGLYIVIAGLIISFFAVDLLFNFLYTYSNECFGLKLRSKLVPLIMIMGVFLRVGYSLLCIIYNSYLLCFWIILGVLLFNFISFYYIVESPYILHNKNQKEKLLQSLDYINQKNNRLDKEQITKNKAKLRELLQTETVSKESSNDFITCLFNLRTVKVIVVISLLYINGYTVIGILNISIQHLGSSNILFNQIIFSFVNLIFMLIIFFFADKLKRKQCMIVFSLSSVVIPLTLYLNTILYNKDNYIFISINMILSVLFTGIAGIITGLLPVYITELVPTSVRGFVIGFGLLSGSSSFVISNYFDVFGRDFDINPLIFCLIPGLLSFLGTLTLKETLNKDIEIPEIPL